MNKLKTVLILIFSLSFLTFAAQPYIYGKVIQRNNKPAIGYKIVLEQNGKTTKPVYIDLFGKYAIYTLPSNSRLGKFNLKIYFGRKLIKIIPVNINRKFTKLNIKLD